MLLESGRTSEQNRSPTPGSVSPSAHDTNFKVLLSSLKDAYLAQSLKHRKHSKATNTTRLIRSFPKPPGEEAAQGQEVGGRAGVHYVDGSGMGGIHGGEAWTVPG